MDVKEAVQCRGNGLLRLSHLSSNLATTLNMSWVCPDKYLSLFLYLSYMGSLISYWQSCTEG